MGWYKKWRVNKLLIEVARLRGVISSDLAYPDHYGDLAAAEEELRQLGHVKDLQKNQREGA